MNAARTPGARRKSEFLDSVQKGLLVGAAALVLVMPPNLLVRQGGAAVQPRVASERAHARLADFGSVVPTQEVRQLANWVTYAGDNQRQSFVILDKKDARVYLFDFVGRLKSNTPALLGYAVGDDNAPGIGTKPIAQISPEERTTPAGRFVAEIGMNARGEDVVWVDYDAAVSMHRVLTTHPAERRLERLATPTNEDNRVSYGCINLPVAFFEHELAPAVRSGGAIIYVLPETRSAQQVFGSFDVEQRLKIAQH